MAGHHSKGKEFKRLNGISISAQRQQRGRERKGGESLRNS